MAIDTSLINSNTSGATNSAAANASNVAAGALAGKTTAPSKAEAARTSLAGDEQEFLTLLTTQLKNQDPTEPLDTNQFTQQLATFAGVEQQVNSNSNLEKLIALTQQSRVDSGISYIGKGVDATGNSGFLSSGSSSFVYSLPAGIAKASVSILNATGQVVFTGDGQTATGKNIVSWDGVGNVGDASGKTLDDGRYTIAVNATDAAGKAVTEGVTTYTTGQVNAASFDASGNMNLEVGTLDIPLDQVNAVREIAN